MKLVFEEYFNNLDNWNFEERFIRNYEVQYYMDRNIECSNNLKRYGKKIKNKLYHSSTDDWIKNRKYCDDFEK